MVFSQHRCYKPWMYSKASRTLWGCSNESAMDRPKLNLWLISPCYCGKSRRIILSIEVIVNCPISSKDCIFESNDKRISVCRNSDIVWSMWTWNCYPGHLRKWNQDLRNWFNLRSNWFNSISIIFLSRQLILHYNCIYDRNTRCFTKFHCLYWVRNYFKY